jgi:glutathione peroxidase
MASCDSTKNRVPEEKIMTAPLYEIPVETIDGAATSLAAYEGSVLLVVNVASACGLTPQYAALEQVFEKFEERGFKVLGFPANDFAAQEPGTNAEILEFCQTKFDVRFPMFAKIAVKGDTQHPLYHHLIEAWPHAEGKPDSALRRTLGQHGLGPVNDTDVLWNFEKFLVDRHGAVVGRFAPDIPPDDPIIVEAIEKALEKA